MRKIVSSVMLALILISILTIAFSIQSVKATGGTIYIRADGSLDPPTAPIQRDGNIYTFTADIYDSIVVEKDNIVIDGAGYTLQGTGSGNGISLSGRTNVTVRNTQIKNFYYGVALISSSNNIISGNNITNNGAEGVRLDNSSNNSIRGNKITNNRYEGVGLFSSSNNCISGNNITNNESGVYLDSSSNNSVSGNNITNKWYGVRLFSSNYNSISRNNIANNRYGVDLHSSSKNRFYHNNFIDNSVQVLNYENSSINVWDDGYPSGGNYWSDYTGVDLYSGPYQNETGSDGIGDTPYVINADNQDLYPLMAPWTPSLLPKFKDEWTMFRHDERNTGFSSDTLVYPPFVKLWEFDTGDYVYESVASYDAVYVARGVGVVKLNAIDGSKIWEKDFSSGYYAHGLALGQGLIFVSPGNGTFYALNENNGQIEWVFSTAPYKDFGPAKYVNGIVYVGSSDGNVYAIYANNGTEKWRFATRDLVLGSVAISKDVVYAGTLGKRLYAIDADKGTEKWMFPSTGELGCYVNAIIATDSIVYALADKLYALNASTGDELWHVSPVSGYSCVYYSAIAYGIIYMTSGVQVNAFNATTGVLIWNYTYPEADGWFDLGIIVANKIVYVGVGREAAYPEHAFTLIALDAFDGTLVWQYESDMAGAFNPIIANGRLYATSFWGNKTYCFAPAAIPDFSITASPNILTIQQGSSDTLTITVTSLNGFDQPIQLSVSRTPSGVTTTLNPEQVIPPPGGSATSTLTVSVDATATPGNYTFSVVGTNGTLAHDVAISLEITSRAYKFKVGDLVWTTADVHVRGGPGLNYTVVDTMIKGNKGIVLNGPLYADGYNWWNINYSVGVTGWSAENWLELAPAPPSPSQNFAYWAEAAIKWAEQRIGSEKWWNYCLRFVANAFMCEEDKPAGWDSALDAAKEFYRFNQEPGGWLNAPKGAIIFFDRDGKNEYGHVGIYLGNGSIIHAYGTVRVNTVEEAIAKPDIGRFIGWSYPPEDWRPTKFTFNATWEGINYPVTIFTNSTVLEFSFSQPSAQINFIVAGELGTTGYCNLTIPKSLIKGEPWTVKINGTTIDFQSTSNQTHSFIYFTYTFASTLEVTIEGTWVVPEFPQALILSLFMVLSMLLIAAAKRRFLTKPKHNC